MVLNIRKGVFKQEEKRFQYRYDGKGKMHLRNSASVIFSLDIGNIIPEKISQMPFHHRCIVYLYRKDKIFNFSEKP